jgi:carbonic anhydrase
VQDVRDKFRTQLEAVDDFKARLDRLCELNVVEQVLNVSETTVLRDAWARGQDITVHGWIYGVADGLLSDLNVSVSQEAEALECYSEAVVSLTARI